MHYRLTLVNSHFRYISFHFQPWFGSICRHHSHQWRSHTFCRHTLGSSINWCFLNERRKHNKNLLSDRGHDLKDAFPHGSQHWGRPTSLATWTSTLTEASPISKPIVRNTNAGKAKAPNFNFIDWTEMGFRRVAARLLRQCGDWSPGMQPWKIHPILLLVNFSISKYPILLLVNYSISKNLIFTITTGRASLICIPTY